jgi:predicted TIM-barrel fold metal-dependent hydrolase
VGDRYTVISADCHAGGELFDYRPYLPKRFHDEFDAWAATYEIPYDDLKGPDANRNWDSERRLRELEDDGVVAEVLFPNTVPPFYPKASLAFQPPAITSGDLDRRSAGLQAHNRWLADFCAAAPGRRAGIAQIMLHDIDAAVAEIRWAKDAGLAGGVLLPGNPPGSGLPQLYDPYFEPLWAACAELDLPLNCHSGSAAPDYGEANVDKVMFLLEVTWWANRTLWHLVFGGVLERHPDLQVVFTEQGTAWIPERLNMLDYFADRMGRAGGSQEQEWGAEVVGALSVRPSEYWARQCHVGASFMRPAEAAMRHAVGVDRVMWGNDYPHKEASYPFSLEALRLTFAGIDRAEVAAMLGGNAARLYGFDLDALAPIAARVGPRVDDVARPLADDEIPPEAGKCPAFAGRT